MHHYSALGWWPHGKPWPPMPLMFCAWALIDIDIDFWFIQQRKDEFLGEARGKPIVQLGHKQKVELQWLELRREGESVGELLAAFELVLNEGEGKTTFQGKLGEYDQIEVPEGIAPKTKLHTIEVNMFLCHIILQMARFTCTIT